MFGQLLDEFITQHWIITVGLKKKHNEKIILTKSEIAGLNLLGFLLQVTAVIMKVKLLN